MGAPNPHMDPHRKGGPIGPLMGAPDPISLLGSLRGGGPQHPMGAPNPISLLGSLRKGGPYGGP